MPYWKIYNDSPHYSVQLSWKFNTSIPDSWMEENIRGDWCRKGSEYRFREQDDYVLFKLTWLF